MNDTAPLWRPSPGRVERARITAFLAWLERERGVTFPDYESLWRWSVTDLEGFWSAVWHFFDIRASVPYERVLGKRTMPGAEWFSGARLNVVDQVFRHATADRPAIVAGNEAGTLEELSWHELERQVAALAASLRALGVVPGDRLVAILPNIPQTMVAFLACASVGAVWSVCSPDMGPVAVLDRFRQIAPKVLIAADGYRYGGKDYDRSALLAEVRAALPSLQHTVLVPNLDGRHDEARAPGAIPWATVIAGDVPLVTAQVAADHPLWVVYSSGTTGVPKAIVHGHAGALVEMLKGVGLHRDIGPGDRFHWYTTTGWIMWNVQMSGLVVGATAVLYDGNPGYPDLGVLWRFVERVGATFFGAGAAFYANCMKAGIQPSSIADLSTLRTLGATGSPLPPEAYRWGYEHVKRDLWLVSIAGGTDLAGAFLTGLPTLPVYEGEMQCRALGLKVEAYDDDGRSVVGEVGRARLFRALPVDAALLLERPGEARYRESYFEMYPGVWRHGDWMKSHRAARGDRRNHLRPVGRHDQPSRHPHGHRGAVPRCRSGARGDRLAGGRSRVPRPRVLHAALRRAPSGHRARRDAEGEAKQRDPRRAVGAPRAERDPRDPRSAAHAVGQEDGTADQEAAARAPAGEGGARRRDGESGQPGVVRRVRGAAGARR